MDAAALSATIEEHCARAESLFVERDELCKAFEIVDSLERSIECDGVDLENVSNVLSSYEVEEVVSGLLLPTPPHPPK